MTRREEIENSIGYKLTHAAMAYYRENCTKDLSMDEVFEAGAEWMQDTMIEKACAWLKNNWREYVYQDGDGVVHFGHWEYDFRKSMEE